MVVQASASTQPARPTWQWVVAGYVLVGGGAWFAKWVNEVGDPAAPQVPEGLTVLVLVLLLAQVIERLLEPAVRWIVPSAPEQERNQAAVDAMNAPTNAATRQAAAEAQRALDTQRSNVAVAVWAVATVLGMLLVAVTGAYMLRALGVEGVADKPWLDVWVTGLAIGAGTKPIHDLISRIDDAKKAVKDPDEVS